MHNSVAVLFALTATAGFLTQPSATDQVPAQWGNLKGSIVWGGKNVPARKTISVRGNGDAAHCLQANPSADGAQGTILDEALLINPKSKGINNVFVYLLVEPDAKIPIHPDLKNFPKQVVVDQPACMFWPRAIALREGQILVIKNSAPVAHNFRWIGDGLRNQGGSVVINAGMEHQIKDLAAQRLPLPVECNIHGWMKGRIGVFAHPYFALTDEEGAFEIKNAPVGHFQLMIYHEEIGYRLGLKGKNGEPVVINGGDNNLGNLEMGGKLSPAS
jgi:hypothetical protein